MAFPKKEPTLERCFQLSTDFMVSFGVF
jgi:hypothetical protein